MTGSRAVEARKEIRDLVDPGVTTIQNYKQVMNNLDTIDSIVDANHGALFIGSPISKLVNDNYIAEGLDKHKEYLKRFLGRDVPRGAESEQSNMLTAPDGQQYSIEDLQRIAAGG
jgi:hypothetical protein